MIADIMFIAAVISLYIGWAVWSGQIKIVDKSEKGVK